MFYLFRLWSHGKEILRIFIFYFYSTFDQTKYFFLSQLIFNLLVVLHLVCLAPLWQNRIFELRHLYNKSNQSGLIHDQNVFVKLLQILQRYLQLLLFSNEPILENIVIHIVFRNYQKENHMLLSAVLDSNQLVSAVSWTEALCRTQCFSFFFT